MDSPLASFACLVYVVVALALFGIIQSLVELLYFGATALMLWGVFLLASWLIDRIPVRKNLHRPPPVAKPAAPEKPTPRWLKILEGEDDDED